MAGAIIMIFALYLCSWISSSTANPINITYVDSAARGAVCLDGQLPSYYYAQGSGNGASSWIVFLEGGGWCAYDNCYGWLKTMNSLKKPTKKFQDILDEDQSSNPDFYNWNRVYVSYCDGASFLGDVYDPNSNLTRRGSLIFDAVMEDLFLKGMWNAENAILTGTSAGGLAAILHCDGFRVFIPIACRFKCIADAGFFIRGDAKEIPASKKMLSSFQAVVDFHGVAPFLPISCTAKMNAALCMFPENVVNDIQTPLFLLQSSMDSFQTKVDLVPEVTYNASWENCTEKVQNCSSYGIKLIKDFRTVFLKTLQDLGNPPPSRGLFVHSCVIYSHFFSFLRWDYGSPILGNKNIKKAIGDWYFDRSPFQEIDTTPDVEPIKC